MLSQKLIDELIEFRRARDWEKFHSTRNIAAAISVEAAELLECFAWALDGQLESVTQENLNAIADEIADIAILLTYLSNDLSIDIDSAVTEKIKANALKYPIEKAHGSNKKYTKL